MKKIADEDIFGFVKPDVDVHTLGIMSAIQYLSNCGYVTKLADERINKTLSDISRVNNITHLVEWIRNNQISRLGYSYRLDPKQGCDYFCKMYLLLKEYNVFEDQGGSLKSVFFAGLPDTCDLVKNTLVDRIVIFQGDETPIEMLSMLGVPENKMPSILLYSQEYDNMLFNFGKQLIEDGKYKYIQPQDHFGYSSCGTSSDSYIDRYNYCQLKKSFPIIRAHVGPYQPDRLEAVNQFKSWIKELTGAGYLDVLSIGSSQLTQSNFGDNWEGLPNGGGVPINSVVEYKEIAKVAKPMLVRTYAGTRDVPAMAKLHEDSLNISWHALSFWWFCDVDGRGKNCVLDNLKEHIEATRYIASTGKPLEPNVPHHFAFRGSDDITYIISGYIAAKCAKLNGIKHLILQNMLNTPKSTFGIQDLAKGRVLLKLVRSLEDADFKVSLQTRAGLDFFSPDIEKAKVQLAAVTALMDDLEPEDDMSPQIIHTVSYSEAIRLAIPDVINDSIKITISAIKEYRRLRRDGKVSNMKYDKEVGRRYEALYDEAKQAINYLELVFSDLYSANGLHRLFALGFFPVPYLVDSNKRYPKVTNYKTVLIDGGVKVIDDNGCVLNTLKRYKSIVDNER